MLEPHDGVMGIGSGSPFATAASRCVDYTIDCHDYQDCVIPVCLTQPNGLDHFQHQRSCIVQACCQQSETINHTLHRALMDVPGLDAKTIALRAMKIAADMCVYTNSNFIVEVRVQPSARMCVVSYGLACCLCKLPSLRSLCCCCLLCAACTSIRLPYNVCCCVGDR